MKTTPDHIHQLMTEKLAAIISAADEHYLDELIENDWVVRQKWEALRQTCMPSGPDSAVERLNKWPEEAAQLRVGAKLVTMESRTSPTGGWKKWAGVAAAIAVVVAGWLLFQDRPFLGPESPALVSRPGSLDHIQLELANGKKIDLSEIQGSLNTDGVKLISDKETLTFQPEAAAAGMNTLAVPAGATYRILLADSTQVWLNSMTTLSFPFEFSGDTREITIDGEAYLNVAENPLRPFIVHLPNSDVRVTGTEFNVNTYEAATDRIALVEGAVSLTAGNAVTTLTPGTQATYDHQTGWKKSDFDSEKVLGWREGIFYFYDTTLEDISGVITRWFGITVVVDHPAMQDRRFAGMLDKNQSLDVFLENLKAVAGIHYYFTEQREELHFTKIDSGGPR